MAAVSGASNRLIDVEDPILRGASSRHASGAPTLVVKGINFCPPLAKIPGQLRDGRTYPFDDVPGGRRDRKSRVAGHDRILTRPPLARLTAGFAALVVTLRSEPSTSASDRRRHSRDHPN